jgi:hypothetical protein
MAVYDFTENYSFAFQEKMQGLYCRKPGTTVTYYGKGSTTSSYVAIRDCIHH